MNFPLFLIVTIFAIAFAKSDRHMVFKHGQPLEQVRTHRCAQADSFWTGEGVLLDKGEHVGFKITIEI